MPSRPNKLAVKHWLATLVLSLVVLAPGRNYAITVDRSQEDLRSLPLASPAPNAGQFSPGQINRQLDRVLRAPEYAWRNPSKNEAAPGWLEQFQDWVRDALESCMRALRRLAEAIAKWIASLIPQGSGFQLGGTDGVSSITQVLTWVTIIGAAAVIILILVRLISRRPATKPPPAPAAAATPDLESENTTADQLPEDEWLRLARRKAEAGDLRQALRALFLAALSLLGAEGLILIRRSKSNFDYERELQRKPSNPSEINDIFSADRKLFERCWYGAYPVTATEFEQSDSLYQRLKHVCLRKNDA